MSGKHVAGLVALGLMLGASAGAQAAPFQVTYKGTVSSGTDGSGLFGGYADLTGEDFTFIAFYDTDPLPGIGYSFGNMALFNAPYTGGSLQIGSFRDTLGAPGDQGANVSNSFRSDTRSLYDTFTSGEGRFDFTFKPNSADAQIPHFLNVPYASSLPPESASGTFAVRQTIGTFSPTSVVVSAVGTNVSTVPLPAALPMFGGALLVFAAARRTRRSA